ncbi:winged helix-turn-helix domain-containing protein (plasmid) [Ruegeria conchae]|uniref:winged helix-turn-helix domain-containing tetratricopeptide repeat protein n=1 Tax=Ruegeria conchae TaxID=981384 RepID=UPI0021A671AB|nr:winged helix-turn-helix domain-containing protein [Ruegeria conchae]UWR05670.1 winged helix-turn-helix domain-containing protein [Ruegeria conchae]
MKPEIRPKSGILLIGHHRYDPASGALTEEDGTPVQLRRQSSNVLAVLAANPGEVVGREELIETVWRGVATTDDSLIQCIADIRRALGKDAVVTYPKIGYRLAVSVAEASARAETQARPSRFLAVVGATALLAAGVVAWQFWPQPDTIVSDPSIVPPRIAPEKTLAVLPFVNLGGGDSLQFFGDGLSEDLTTDLAKISDLTVISYASSGDFAGAEAGFSDIAEDLGVRYLVRGTVRHSGERVRINVSLVDPYEGVNIWAERFDRVRQNPFDVQEDVARAIVDALSLTLEAEHAPTRVAPDAYFMLLRGLEPLRENTIDGNRRAREFFQQALELDPNYARAHAFFAVAHGRDTMFDYSGDPGRSSIQKGLEAAITAIQLDPELPYAYFALAILNLAIGEHDKALAAARHSIRLNRNFADGYAILAEAGVYGGDLSEALEAILYAKRLHPHHPPSYHWIEGHIRFQLGDAEGALPLLKQTIEMTPGFAPAFVTLAAVYSELGDQERSQSVLAAVLALEPGFSVDKFLELTPYGLDERLFRLTQALGKVKPD